MKALAAVLTLAIVFGMAMAIIAKVDNTDKVYDPIHHLDAIQEGFDMIPSFEELTTYTSAAGFLVPRSQEWRFRGFYVAQTADFIVVYPDYIKDKDWGVFEWINEPLGAIVSFFVRANAVTWWLTDWTQEFFANVDVLFPSAGMVERSTT